MSYLIKHDLITIDQFAFLKNHSTVGCLHRLLDDWYEAINEREYIMACFFDIQKCFDTIDHAILLEKLRLHGIKGVELKWFTHYLEKRKQYVYCNGQTSELQQVTTGVPQGSSLGPLLFLIFINDFPQHIKHSISNMFADDGVIYNCGKSFQGTLDTLQSSVNDAGALYHNNNLPVSIPKSVSMLGASERTLRALDDEDRCLNLKLNGTTLQQVSFCPYLGVQLDNSLKWSAHIPNLCKNLAQKVGLLNRLRKTLNKSMLNKLYLTTIQPRIDYAISVWGYCPENYKEHIRRLQHRAARIVCNNFDYVNVRGHDLMSQLRWQTIEQRRDYFTATLMHRCINGEAPVRLTNELVMTADAHNFHTRAAINGNVKVPKPHTELFRNSFKYRGPMLWNSLPPELKNISNIDVFKNVYKKIYFNNTG